METIVVLFLAKLLPMVMSTIIDDNWKKFDFNLKGTEECVFKIKIFSDNQESVDISESLLLQQFRIYYLFGSQNDTASSSKEFELDYRFYEKCSINYVVNYNPCTDSSRRESYILAQRDTYRGLSFANCIIVTKFGETLQITPSNLEYRLNYRLLFIFLQNGSSALFHFCPYCFTTIKLYPIPRDSRIFDLNPLQFRNDWKPFNILIHRYPVNNAIRQDCAQGLTNRSFHCRIFERWHAFLSATLNISFASSENIEDSKLPQNKHGYFKDWIENPSDNYTHLRQLTFVQSPARILGYCNFERRADNFSFSVWLKPFRDSVWILLGLAAIAIVLVTCFKVCFTPVLAIKQYVLLNICFNALLIFTAFY